MFFESIQISHAMYHLSHECYNGERSVCLTSGYYIRRLFNPVSDCSHLDQSLLATFFNQWAHLFSTYHTPSGKSPNLSTDSLFFKHRRCITVNSNTEADMEIYDISFCIHSLGLSFS